MIELTKDLIEKAKGAQNAQELFDLAKAENVDMTLEQATEYMKALHPTSGEIDDNELDNVTGGCGARSGERVSYDTDRCKDFECPFCGSRVNSMWYCYRCEYGKVCFQCKYYRQIGNQKVGICTHP